MKNKKENITLRRKEIMRFIQQYGKATVNELEIRLNVSPLTIRRDLQYWEEKGAIERYYGGARLIQKFVDDKDITENDLFKHAIAKYAAQYVEEGDTIFINTSSTALLVLRYIKNKHVTVITNNGKAIFMEHDPLVSIVLSGGELRIPKESMVGDFALNNLNKVTADKCFLGCSGFDHKAGMSTAILQEVSINETMINRCRGHVFMLADHTKIENIHQFIVSDINAFSYLITDRRTSDIEMEDFQAAGLKVVRLDPMTAIYL